MELTDPLEIEDYGFNWPGKKRAEELAKAPPQVTLVPDFKKSVDFDHSSNILVEGDNLCVMKKLSESLSGRIDVIYIDPPYNTGANLVYHDRFTNPLKKQNSAPSDIEAHSNWLSMMYPRLLLAHRLLSPQGVIFVSIDDNELHHLRLLMDLIFGENCFKNCIIVRRGAKSVQAQFDKVSSLTVGHEYVLLYSKDPSRRFPKLRIERSSPKKGTWNNHWRGTNRPTMRYELFGIVPKTGQWRWGRKRSLAAIQNYERLLKELDVDADEVTDEQIDNWYLEETLTKGGRVDLLRLSSSGKPEHYVPPSDTMLGTDLWIDIRTSGSSRLKQLFGKKVFDNPKPVELITRILSFTTDASREYIILDFFAGSCTTAEAVLKMNYRDNGKRQFIMIQSAERLREPITLDDGTTLHTISDIGRERISRVIAEIRSEKASGPSTGKNPHCDTGFRFMRAVPFT